MTYYFFATCEQLNFDSVKNFLYRSDKAENCAAFAVNDDNFADFLSSAVFADEIKGKISSLGALGEDGNTYAISLDGIKKISENAGRIFEKEWKNLCKFYKKLQREQAYREKIFSRCENGIIKISGAFFGFKKFLFTDKNTGTVIPFRYKKSKKDNRPLAVFFGGGGTVGKDNLKPLFEFLFLSHGRKIMKHDCNILIPQSLRGSGALDAYTCACADIARQMLDTQKIDRSRVYAFGTSFGGKCTWSSLFAEPNLYAAAIPVMGELYDYESADFQKIAHIPVWIAHSSDDNVVKIDSDDYCHEKLSALGADVKYTRWENYGHDMYKKFYKNEDWAGWLMSKSK